MQRRGALAGAVRHPHGELRRVIVEHGQDQSGSGFGAGMDVVGKVAPDDVASGGLAPPLMDHAVSVSNRLERTDRLTPCGACFLIWRTWAAVSGPSSAWYCGSTRTASSCS